MSVSRMFLVTAAFGAAVVLAGCSSDPAAPEPGGTVDAAPSGSAPAPEASGEASGAGAGDIDLVLDDKCAVLVGVDLADLAGQPPTSARSALEGCVVFAGTESLAKVTVSVWEAEGGRGYDEAVAEFGPGTGVDGVGDAAFDAGSHLVVKWDDKLVTILISSEDPGTVIATDTMADAARVIMANSDAQA